MAIAGYIVVILEFHKEGRRWVACCEELGTATFGRSLPEAEKRIKEAVSLHLNTLEDVGERKRFFQEHNIISHHTRPSRDFKISAPITKNVFYHPYVQPIPELVH